jgi:outer membrane murein-binding lipoprotein Lpp
MKRRSLLASIGTSAVLASALTWTFSPGIPVANAQNGTLDVAHVIEAKLDKLEGKADKLEAKHDRMVQAMDKTFAAQDEQHRGLDAKVAACFPIFDRFERKLDKLEGKADKAEAKLDRLERKFDYINQKFEAKLDRLESKIDRWGRPPGANPNGE